MCNSWLQALNMYNWTVDLRHFGNAANYGGYFNRIIPPNDVVNFENNFRISICEITAFEIAGEVCFWKNYGNVQARNRVTQKLLNFLANADNQYTFVSAVRDVSNDPNFDNFLILKNACNQPRGFATPITFLSFYNPVEYPMVDKHIANWWRVHKANFGYGGDYSDFSQRDDGWIQTYTNLQNQQNWNAYLAWKKFCCDYAERIQRNCKLNWRARDVEIAVWISQRNGLVLNIL